MTLQEILDEIKEKYPHNLTDESVIRKINLLQEELFRTVYKPETATQYDITEGLAFYPIDFSPTKIISVLVNDEPYPYKNLREEAYGNFYYLLGNSREIGLYPEPTENIDGGLIIFHTKEPYKLTTSDISREPDFDRNFHMILVYGTLISLAENYQDDTMINNFTSKYNGLMDDFLKTNNETPEYPIIENVMGVI